MFDTFNPLQVLQNQEFSFIANSYEIWEAGKKTQSGTTHATIVGETIEIENEEKMKVLFSDNNLFDKLASKNIFDLFISQKDRLQLICIPKHTNSENLGIAMFQSILGSTREFKNFDYNEPYCCNLFLQQGILKKVTFSFSCPERLIEFYD